MDTWLIVSVTIITVVVLNLITFKIKQANRRKLENFDLDFIKDQVSKHKSYIPTRRIDDTSRKSERANNSSRSYSSQPRKNDSSNSIVDNTWPDTGNWHSSSSHGNSHSTSDSCSSSSSDCGGGGDD